MTNIDNKKRVSPKKKYPKSYRKKNHSIRAHADASLDKIFECIGKPKETPFIPDPFQLDALNAVQEADCLVTAPTGAGKTWIAQQAILKIYNHNGKAWYASPLKALSNVIYNQFAKNFGEENVGILTGDRKENPDAPIIIGTTEILRNQLYEAMQYGRNLDTDLVILDEAHYLGDAERGVVWEEIMIYLPSRIPLLLLSATIGNASQITKWLTSIRKRRAVVIKETNRPVPLHYLFFHPSGSLLPLLKNQSSTNTNAQISSKVGAFMEQKKKTRLLSSHGLPPFKDILKVLKKYNLLPALFFLKSRNDCNNALNLCSNELLNQDPDRKAILINRITGLLENNEYLYKHKQLWHLKHLGVGAHHSGQLPVWKMVIEHLMAEGLLDAVFATSTVAAGVNFPARTVVVLNSDRFNGIEFIPLNPSEFHQMTGRAGRRGMDNIGFTMILPGRFMDLSLMANLTSAPPIDVNSQIKINFTMVLNLLLSNSPNQIKELLDKSFANYLILKSPKFQRLIKAHGFDEHYLWSEFNHHLDFLKNNGFVADNNILTEDGRWTSKLRVDQPLLIAEGFRLNLFPENNPTLLAAIIAAFVSDRAGDDEIKKKANIAKPLLTSFLKIKRKLKPFSRYMMDSGFEVRPLYIEPAKAIYGWAKGSDWQEACLNAQMAEGDLARLILRTSDHLRHIENLHDVFPKIAKTAAAAIESIMKEPVTSYF